MSSTDRPLAQLCNSLLQRWRAFPQTQRAALEAELGAALTAAAAAEPELITVMNPTSRPQRLRLAVLVSDASLDTMYAREWAELSVSSDGHCYLVYRRRDGGDYAVEWSPATALPTAMSGLLSEPLALALYGSDDET